MSLREFLQRLKKFTDGMNPHWDSYHLELFGDGSGSIKYEWPHHPFADKNEIPFNSIGELAALIGLSNNAVRGLQHAAQEGFVG